MSKKKDAELSRKIQTSWDRYLERYNSSGGLVYDWYWWAYSQGVKLAAAVAEAQDRVLN